MIEWILLIKTPQYNEKVPTTLFNGIETTEFWWVLIKEGQDLWSSDFNSTVTPSVGKTSEIFS